MASADAVSVAVENVPATFGGDLDGAGGRSVCGIYRIPVRIFGSRVGNVRLGSQPVVSRLLVIRPIAGRPIAGRPAAVGRAERLVVLRAGPRFDWLGPSGRDVAA